jgi:hypothetical protein
MLILNMALNFTFICDPKYYKCDNPNCPPIHAFTPTCNQQLFLTFVIPYSPYTNDNDKNGSKPSTMNRTFEFFNRIHVEKHGN